MMTISQCTSIKSKLPYHHLQMCSMYIDTTADCTTTTNHELTNLGSSCNSIRYKATILNVILLLAQVMVEQSNYGVGIAVHCCPLLSMFRFLQLSREELWTPY